MSKSVFDAGLLRLYAVTDRAWTGEMSLEAQVQEALEGGVTMVQLREKNLNDEEFLAEAIRMKALTDRYNVPLIINDNIDVCIKSGAAGVHVGQRDMQAGRVRELLGEDKIIGVTAKTPEQARLAYENGADYIGCGAVFGSATKKDTSKISLEQLDAVCMATPLPVTAIGGISADNIAQLSGHAMDGAAVVSAIFAQPDIKAAARQLANIMSDLCDPDGVRVRAYTDKDCDEMIRIWNEVVEDGIAFPQIDDLDAETGRRFWEQQTYCAVAEELSTGKVRGMYILHPNNVGRCGHISNASFAVSRDARGMHLGEKLVKDCLKQARKYGFSILQFNAVVASNIHARHLYERLGFEQLGVIPKGFLMKDGHYEDICPYYREV